MKTYEGNILIDSSNYEQWNEKLKDCEKITGGLYIYSQAKLDNLKSVGGYLYIYSQAKLEAPELKSVGGYLSIYSQAKLEAPELKSVGGDLYINSQAKLEAPELKSVGGYLYINSQAKLDNLKSVRGYLYINSQAKLEAPELKSVGGDLYINSRISEKLIKQLYFHNSKKTWYINDQQSEWIYSKLGKFTYEINAVEFPKGLFDKVRKNELSAKEVFAIENTEQRRIAYERMDKIKMKDLKTKVLSNGREGKYPVRVVEITFDEYDEPFRYLNCFCPSSSREYFIETTSNDWRTAKMSSFGLDENIKFDKEW